MTDKPFTGGLGLYNKDGSYVKNEKSKKQLLLEEINENEAMLRAGSVIYPSKQDRPKNKYKYNLDIDKIKKDEKDFIAEHSNNNDWPTEGMIVWDEKTRRHTKIAKK